MDNELRNRLERCEQRLRTLRIRAAIGTGFLACCGIATAAYQLAPSGSAQALPSLRVSEVVVVDSKGVERVRIGGELPDAVVDGKPRPRGQMAAGILLYDRTGRERSGYVTFAPNDYVGLTLDSQQGQTALFMASPIGGTALRMWRGNTWVELRSDEAGARINAVRSRELVFREPQALESERTAHCLSLKSEGEQAGASDRQLFNACRERFGEAECRICIDVK